MEENQLLQTVRGLVGRYRHSRSLLGLLHGTVWGAVLAVMAVLTLKILGWGMPDLLYGLLPVPLVPLLVWLWLRTRPIKDETVALLVDYELGLKERLTTALDWIQSRRPKNLMYKALLKELGELAASIQAARLFQVRPPKSLRSLAATLPTVMILMMIPPWSLFPPSPDAIPKDTLDKTVTRLEMQAERLIPPNRPPEQLPRSHQAKDALRKLAKELNKPNVGKREALSKVSSLMEKLAQDLNKNALDPSYQQRLQRAGLINTKADNQKGPTSQESAASQLKKMAQQLKPPNNPDSQSKQKMADALKKMTEALKSDDPLAKSLQQAMQQMQQGQNAQAAETLEKASQELQAAEAAAMDREGLEKALSELQNAKDALSGEGMPSNDGQPGNQMANDGFNSKGQSVEGYEPVSGPGGQLKPGKGKGEADYGVGSTDKYSKTGKEAKAKNWVLDRQNNTTSDLKGEYKKLYTPERKEIAKGSAEIKGMIGRGPAIATNSQIKGAPTMNGTASSPEGEVYLDYRRKAEESMLKENIPPEYRGMVRQYFDTIDPRTQP